MVGLVGLAALLLVIVSLVVRYARGNDHTRRQLLWLVLALVVVVVRNVQRLFTGDGPILLLLSFALMFAAVVIAIVWYELFDIQFVLSRTFVYAVTLSVVIAGYAGTVALLSLLVSTDGQRDASVAAAIVAALCLNPVRLLLQQTVDRAFYGDPARTARHVGERLQHDDDLDGVLDRARTTLRLPGLALRRMPDGAQLAVAGRPGVAESAVLLSYQGETVGQLVIQLRPGETSFT